MSAADSRTRQSNPRHEALRCYSSTLTALFTQWFYRYFLPEKVTSEVLRDPVLSPLRAKSLANLPPALVVPAEVDVLRDEGIAYARRLGQENEGFTELWLAKRVPHPFPHQTEATDVAKEFRRLAVARLREAFDGSLTGGRKFVSNVDV